MDFYTVSKYKRPVRLKESTRLFAYDSLHHRYGRETYSNYSVSLDDVENYNELSDYDKYDLIIRRIVEKAPLRICDGELLSGAATLGGAIDHGVPASYNNHIDFGSVSHLTINFETVLKRGINGIKEDVVNSIKNHTDERKLRFLKSCLATIDSLEIYRQRYIKALEDKADLQENLNILKKVPFGTPSNFREAMQSIWFVFSFVRLTGNWPGFGRLDYLVGDYLKKDLSNGTLTLDEAREILAHFFIKGCEWIKGGDCISGDAQHYQNLVISGIDENGNDITNEVTYLILDVIEELGISDFPTTVRLNKNTSEKLLHRCAEVVRYGGGILAFYDEESIIKSLINYGYPASKAWKFANDGCWEVQIPGETYFTYNPFDALEVLQSKTLKAYKEELDYKDFDSLYKQYLIDLGEKVDEVCNARMVCYSNPKEMCHQIPCTVVSLFETGCIENAVSYLEGGTNYTVFSPHIGGMPDVVNSLYVIKKLVFEEKKLSLNNFIKVLQNNWDGEEALRRYVLNSFDYYGNDNDECDKFAVEIVDRFAAACKKNDNKCSSMFPPGISTFGRQLQWLPHRLASPHGHKKEELLAGNTSPTPGSDKNGATAIIKSYCKSDLTKMVTGAALDLRLLPSYLDGEDGLDSFIALLRGFISLGGSFIQPDVTTAEILHDAQDHPENYQTLSVRVSGWNARFVTLNKEWQDMIINENEK